MKRELLNRARHAKSELEKGARRGARVGAFVGLTSAMLAVYQTHQHLTPEAERAGRRERYIKRWSQALLTIFGIDLVVIGATPPQEGARGRLIVSNHRSTIDIMILLRHFAPHIVSREDLAHWPLVGAAARSVGTVFVDRDNTTSGVQAIREMQRLLQAGRVVGVFPEGTTFPDDEVRPFHKGAFVAAKMADAEILPVGLAYEGGADAAFVDETFGQHMSRLAGAKKTRVALAVGNPLIVQKNADRTAQAARDVVADLVVQARAALTAR